MKKNQSFLQKIKTFFTTGKTPYIFTGIYLVITTLLVFFFPQQQVFFLMFLFSAFLIYVLPTQWKFKLLIGVITALLIIPVLGVKNIFYFEVIFQICLFAALALGLNIVVGFAGLLDLGYVAFYAVGAYLWAFFGSQQIFLLHEIPGTAPANTPFLLPPDTFFIFIPLGMVMAAIAGILLGLPVLRVRGDYLAIVTLGFGEVIRVLANNLDKPLNLTNGPQGISPIQRPTIPQVAMDAINTVLLPIIGRNATPDEFYNLLFYLLALIIIIGVIFFVIRIDNSKIGRSWAAIREDELAATAMGINIVNYKLSAFAVGASCAGIMGVLFAASRTFVSPESFNFMQSIGVLSMVILGGLGSIPGAILGAAVVVLLNLQILQGISLWISSLRQSGGVIPIINYSLSNISTQLDPAQYQRMIFGLILVVMMVFRPDGLIPAKRRLREVIKSDEDDENPPKDEKTEAGYGPA